MKKNLLLLLSCVVVLAFVGGLATAEEEKAWFDIENCAFCKHLGAEEGMLETVRWETHLTATGAVTLTQVPAKFEEAFEKAEEHMQETAMKLGHGEDLHLCAFCQSHGELMMAGVKIENFKGHVARVTIMSSDDEKLVEMIHAHAEKTIAEYTKWLAVEKG